MNKILSKKINNILDIDKDREYINFSHKNNYINLKNFFDITEIEKSVKNSDDFKIKFKISPGYQDIIEDLKKIDNHNDFNNYLYDKNIEVRFDSKIVEDGIKQQKNSKKKTIKASKSPKTKDLDFQEDDRQIVVSPENMEYIIEEFSFSKMMYIDKVSKELLYDLKQFKNIVKEAVNYEITTGKWMLKIGFDFIYGMVNETSICAPVFFRDIIIEIIDNEIIITSSNAIEFNEKLHIFIMKELKKEVKENKKTFETFETFKEELEVYFNYKIEDVENEDFSEINEKEEKKTFRTLKHSNLFIISLFDSKSGKIKEDFIELMQIKSNMFDKNMKNDNEYYQREEFLNPALIQLNNPLNIQQKYAVRSAMSENTIIYGPPGTGKSEIITSIVANIMIQEKNLIVVSEKVAALDVIKKRLGKLDSFAFYLKDLDDEKKFYEQIENISDQMGSFYNDEYKTREFSLKKSYQENDRVIDYNTSIEKFRNVLQDSIDFSLKKDSRRNDYRDFLISINMTNQFVKENKTGVEKFWEEYKDKYVKLQSPTEFISKVAEFNWFKTAYNIAEEEISKYDKMRNDLTNFLVENDFVDYTIDSFENVSTNVQELELFIKKYMMHKDKAFVALLLEEPIFLLDNYKIMKRITSLLSDVKQSKSIITFLFKNITKHDRFLMKLSSLGSEKLKLKLTERYFLKGEIVVKNTPFTSKPDPKTLLVIIDSIREFNEIKNFKNNSYLKNIDELKEEFINPIIVYFHQHKYLLKQNFIDFYNKKIIIFDLRIINQYFKYRVNKIERELINISNYNYEIASKNKVIIEKNIPQLIKSYLKNNQDFILKMDEALYQTYTKYIKNKLSKSSNEFQEKCNKMMRISRMENRPKVNEFINEFLDCLLVIFPVWISKPNLISHYTELKPELFDVGIFDEASQMFLEKAYPILYRCKYVIISGDDKQLKPERLIFNEYLGKEDNYHIKDIEFDDAESLLDRARVAYWNTYTLKNHYRSLSKDLIEFSNDKFYENKLLFGTKNNNSIEPLDIIDIVKNVKVVNGVNKEEANQILIRLKSEVEKNILKKILVICFTETQKEFINNKIFNESKWVSILNKVKRGSVVIGDISSVQGDEGDLSIISVVFTKTNSSFGLLTNPRGSNYLNVAITRAKSKMIIFKSIKSEDIVGDPLNKDLTIFTDWIKYLDTKAKIIAKSKKDKSIILENKPLTNFKKDIYEAIINDSELKNYKFLQNFVLGSEIVDIAVYQNDPHNILLLIILDDWKKNITIESFFADIDQEEYLMSREYNVIRVEEIGWLKNSEESIDFIKDALIKSSVEEKPKVKKTTKPIKKNK